MRSRPGRIASGADLAPGQAGRRTWLCVLLVLAGLALFYPLFVKPVMRVLDARKWIETPCVIQSSSVGSSYDRKAGYAYRVDIAFAYKVGGREFTSEQYQFDDGYSGGSIRVEALPPESPKIAKRAGLISRPMLRRPGRG